MAISKCGELADVAVWNATAWLLHHRQGVSIQSPGDLETKEFLHFTQLPDHRAHPPSDSRAGLVR